MSDTSVADALRSDAHRVVVEAPAGTGKTHQAASYARDAAAKLKKGQRVLILAHTHAACDVFSSRTADLAAKLKIGTIDSLVAMIGKVYHRALDLPQDIEAWSVDQGSESYANLARRVRILLNRSPGVAGAIVERHPIVICDEHQDASEDQHRIVDALARAGARLRFFGDPMQDIFTTGQERQAQRLRWQEICRTSDARERLDTAHRWANGSPELGAWVLEQRELLRDGGSIDLRGRLPNGLQLFRADNLSPRFGGYQLDADSRRPIMALVRNSPNLMVLTAHSATVFGLHAFWGWRIPIWEGYTRNGLSDLIAACRRGAGNSVALGRALCVFLEGVGKGFSASAFGSRLIHELETQCAKPCRGKPAEIQSIARVILQNPTHIGVGAALDLIHILMRTSESFSELRIDLRREFSEARRIQAHPELVNVMARLAHQRGGEKGQLPAQAISTVHKSKGLETRSAMLIPCDSSSMAESEKNRCVLYVALSRACEQMALVVPRNNPSPFFRL